MLGRDDLGRDSLRVNLQRDSEVRLRTYEPAGKTYTFAVCFFYKTYTFAALHIKCYKISICGSKRRADICHKSDDARKN